MELNEAREIINSVDEKMAELFEQKAREDFPSKTEKESSAL